MLDKFNGFVMDFKHRTSTRDINIINCVKEVYLEICLICNNGMQQENLQNNSVFITK